MILSAQSIRKRGIFTPFCERTKEHGMTYGLGPAGYDVRVEFDEDGSIDEVVLYPGDFILASTIEHFAMPNDVIGRVCDKSTKARLGVAVQNTVIEPGWAGYLTLEITHHGTNTNNKWLSDLNIKKPELYQKVSKLYGHNQPIVLKRGMPIAQIILEQLDEPTELSYDKLGGKYQNQKRGPVFPILESIKPLPKKLFIGSDWATVAGFPVEIYSSKIVKTWINPFEEETKQVFLGSYWCNAIRFDSQWYEDGKSVSGSPRLHIKMD